MLQTSTNLMEIFNKYNISCECDTYSINTATLVDIESEDCAIIIEEIIRNPKILKSTAQLNSQPKVKFPFCSWLIGRTEISPQIMSNILKVPVSEASILEDYAFFCNLFKTFQPDEFQQFESDFIKFYRYGITPELRPCFIKLLSNFCSTEISEEWKEILILNWREGRRDLANASLAILLKCKNSNDFFDDFQQFEKIEDLSLLAEIILTTKNEPIFSLFRDRICSVVSEYNNSHRRSKSKSIKIDSKSFPGNSNWIDAWSLIINNLKSWPFPLNDSPIHAIDLLSKLALSAISSDKATFKSFLTCFTEASDELNLELLSSLIPVALEQCVWLINSLPRCLLQLFSLLLKSPDTSQETLLSLCRLFMDGVLGTSCRKHFVNYLASHSDDPLIGERCLSLIETFVEKFPDSRYICLALIKSLIEGVDSWKPTQLIPFYSSYSLMAHSSDSVMNDLIILLKKQIYSSDVLYKRIGARGVGVFLSRNGLSARIKAREQSLLPDPDDTFNDIASCSQKPIDKAPAAIKCDYHLRIIISLLEETVKAIRTDQQSMLIFLKYVNDSFDLLDEELKDWVGDWIRSVFQSTFIKQIDEDKYSYSYEQDEDNPLALDFSDEELRDCASVLLSIFGKFEKYQNADSLESIDALQGCVIQLPSGSTYQSISEEFHLKFVVLNYFRTILNLFEQDQSRLETCIKIYYELREIIKSKPAFLGEYRLSIECNALLQLNTRSLCDNEDFSIPEGSFLAGLLDEARKPENRINRLANISLSDQQLFEVNESNFQSSLVPLKLSLIERIVSSSEQSQSVSEFIYKELNNSIEFHYKSDVESQSKILDILFKMMPTITTEGIEIILKFKKESISSSQRSHLMKLCKEVFQKDYSISSESCFSALVQNVCLLVIDVLKCPEMISKPINIVKIMITNQTNSQGALKRLLMLPNLKIEEFINDIKNETIPLKNRMILLKSLSSRFVTKLKRSELAESQEIMTIWAELIQYVRSSNSNKLLQVIIKESHVVLSSFLSSSLLKQVESNALLLDGSGERDSILLLLKTVQQSTRGLQIICNHLKYSKEAKELLIIPTLKKTLEALIFRVKDILTRSGCLGAFWIGNLKHRDLEGQEISSQVELLKLDDDDDDEEESKDDSEEIISEEEPGKLSEEYIYDSEIEEI